jgi:beta-galactosidase
MGHGIQSVLPYNLDTLITTTNEAPRQRIFDVYINDKLAKKNINLAAKFGVANSVQQKFECLVAAGSGISISFKGINGKPVLNALQVRKIE